VYHLNRWKGDEVQQDVGLGRHGEFIDALSDLGLATLMFLAGYEIDFGRISGPPRAPSSPPRCSCPAARRAARP